jgi:AAA domain
VPKKLRVWYWNGEDPAEETERRIAAILLHFRIQREAVEGWVFADTGRKTPVCIAKRQKDGVMFTPDAEALTQAITAANVDVFICDPFVKTHSVQENDNGEIDQVVTEFAEIADKTNCAIELPHHVRKSASTGRAEVTADDGRGAGSLKDGGRAVRVMNQMATEEAVSAQVEPRDRKRYFRVDDDAKANMQPPAESADWFKIVSVPLYNDPDDMNEPGDNIGVVVKWALPGVFAGLTDGDVSRVKDAIAAGDWAKDVQAVDWAGHAVARVLDIDVSEELGKERVKQMLKAWIKGGALKTSEGEHPRRRGHKRATIVVGDKL